MLSEQHEPAIEAPQDGERPNESVIPEATVAAGPSRSTSGIRPAGLSCASGRGRW